jgi:hypothetical protein
MLPAAAICKLALLLSSPCCFSHTFPINLNSPVVDIFDLNLSLFVSFFFFAQSEQKLLKFINQVLNCKCPQNGS